MSVTLQKSDILEVESDKDLLSALAVLCENHIIDHTQTIEEYVKTTSKREEQSTSKVTVRKILVIYHEI